jgi:hypothetical protein
MSLRDLFLRISLRRRRDSVGGSGRNTSTSSRSLVSDAKGARDKTEVEFDYSLQAEIDAFVERVVEGCSDKVLNFIQDTTHDQIKAGLGQNGLKV